LALSLKAGDNGNTCKMPNLYRFYQGTAMGKPSLILVEITHFEKDVQVNDQTNNKVPQKGKVSFTLYGQMEVDNVEKIEVEDEKLMTESSQ
jgi:predicted PhzF superfamily epimerase YddE/YHI9